VSKLSDANSEAAETIVWLDIASSCGYLQHEKAEQFESGYREIIGGLISMMDQSEKWCAPSREMSEYAVEYEAFDFPSE